MRLDFTTYRSAMRHRARCGLQQIVQETKMANTASAKKAVRKIARQTDVNKARRSRMRTYIRKVESAIESGDKGAASADLVAAQPEIMRSAQKGIIHKSTASRKISRLSARIGAMAS